MKPLQRPSSPSSPVLPLAANDPPRRRLDRVPVYDTPEETLVVSFEGLTPAEQHLALAGFPGGGRFVLAGDAD